MTGTRSRTGKRSAFTIIELMVVILIIAILVSLVTAGVVKVLNKIPEVQTRTEISELETALQAFMTDYGLSEPPPSVLVLNEASPLTSPSGSFLTKVFGKNLGPTDWNGDGTIAGIWTLEGEQCLVFYTGGIPNTAQMLAGSPPECLGFATNNMKPSYGSMLGEVMGRRKGPYFTFQSGRLMLLGPYPPPPAPPVLPCLYPINIPVFSPFFVYFDPWKVKNGPGGLLRANGWPYAYFSSNGTNNSGYLQGAAVLTSLGPPWAGRGDCQGIGAAPYSTGFGYTYSNKYQIISAGQNGLFGTAAWVPSSGATGVGFDDQANFSAGLLGTGQR